MKMNNWSGEMRQQVLQLLQERNRKEKGFTELFKHHERLFENWAAVRLENIRLMQNQGGYGGRDDGGGEEKDKKILRLQEELTELHRNRGENASQVLSLSAKLTQKEAELSALQSQNAELVARIADLEEKEAQLNNNLHEHEATIALLHDEHSVLQLDFTSLEEKFRKLQMEYSELLQRYMLVKNQHAEVMNRENELFMEKKRAAVQKELEDAASEKVVTPVEGPPILGVEIPQIPTICIVPKNAAHKFEAHENEVNSIRWSPNAKHFATGGADRKVKIWEYTHTGIEPRGMLTGSNGAVLSIDFDTAGTLILASSSDFACRVWGVDDRRLRHTLTGHSNKVLAAKFMGDPYRVASGSHDRTLKIWDLRSRACVSTKFAGSSCNDLVCVGTGSPMISGHFDKRIRFWDARMESDSPGITLQGKITSLDLSRDQNSLLASVRDDSIEVLDLRMNTVSGHFVADGFKLSSDFSRACFSPDGRFIACGSADGSIYVWSVLENKLEAVLKDETKHSSPIGAVHWQADSGNVLLSADRSKKVVAWTP